MTINPPIAAAAITPVLDLDFMGVRDCVGRMFAFWDVLDEAPEVELELKVELELELGVELLPLVVVEGEVKPRHDVSVLAPTVWIWLAPPWRPLASTNAKTIDVPAGTLAVQSNEDDPTGGWSENDGPPGISPKIVIGWAAAVYALKENVLHCWRAKLVWNWNSGPGSVVLQVWPLAPGLTVMTFEVPPVPKPVASDMVRRSCWPDAKGNWAIWNVFESEAGKVVFLGVPNIGAMKSWKGACPPVHEIEKGPHETTSDVVKVKARAEDDARITRAETSKSLISVRPILEALSGKERKGDIK
jgi:hypothetical protein